MHVMRERELMLANSDRARNYINHLLRTYSVDELRQRLEPKLGKPSARIPSARCLNLQVLERHWQVLGSDSENRRALSDPVTLNQIEHYRPNIENFIGTAKIPVGVAGPLRVNGLFAQGDYYVPLATTEAALVASYSRGAQLISEAGGCTAMLLNEGVSRAPGFVFSDLREAGLFVAWAVSQQEEFKRVSEATTRHGKLINTWVTVEGNHVYLRFEFSTGDAAGQNMVTIATEAICSYIRDHSPVRPAYSTVEANFSGDKKASAQSFVSVRGRKVTAEVFLAPSLIKTRLRTTPEQMVKHWLLGAMGGVLSGTIGVQGHYANGLAALFIACGQDVACVAEAAVGVTRFELTASGELYASVTLPNLIVGTVGGGTGLPSQQACLRIMGLAGPGKAKALAEVCAGLCLAGELSIMGALCAGDFARAHRCLARGRRDGEKAKAKCQAKRNPDPILDDSECNPPI
jgi:hydroxymethylglutaryl-CoA reductase (NADPH)